MTVTVDTRAPIKARFMAKVVLDPSGCWIWTGYRDRAGYGRFSPAGRATAGQLAHRVAYELFVGPIPEGLTIDHVAARGCTSKACVNPEHLEPVTLVENVMRGSGFGVVNAAKTHCKYGHPYDEANTRYTRQGYRVCRTCSRAYESRRVR